MAATITTPTQVPDISSPWPTSATQNERTVNVLLTTFAGLGLPRTLSLPTSASTTTHDLLKTIHDRLPEVHHTLIITTTSNKQLLPSSHSPISTFLASPTDTFLPLRLSARLCGGKGGFGSQLRAAGGRMSSRKSRDQNRNPNGSNRTLEGRRVRVVARAKELAEQMAKEEEVQRKAREERKQRLEDTVEAAERRMESIREGKAGVGQGRLDAEFVESKEAAEEKTREAVLKALREEDAVEVERTGSESSMGGVENGSEEDEVEEGSSGSSEDIAPVKAQSSGPAFFGWDDEDDSDEEDVEEDVRGAEGQTAYKGKGKVKA